MSSLRTAAWILSSGTSLLSVAAAAQTGQATSVDTVSAEKPAEDEAAVIVLGSRIRRQIDQEGPAPVTAITSDDILRNGYQSVPDVLRAITQNGGET